MKIEVRRAEPGDYKAVPQVHAQPRAIWGTLQLPFPSEELWKKRLSEPADDMVALVACVEGEVVAMAGLHLHPKSPRSASRSRARRRSSRSATARTSTRTPWPGCASRL